MQTMIALLKRECQEHLFGFAWSPVAVLGLIIVVMSLGLVIAGSNTATISISSDTRNSEHHNHEQFEITDSLSSLSRFINFGVWSDEQLSTNLKGFRLSIAIPFQYLYVLIAIFVLLGALHDDRRDRSVLFWKSMPVTDAQTVLSKLIAVVWVAPVAVIAAIVAAQLFLLVVVSGWIWAEDLGSVARLWRHSGMLIGTTELVVGYLIQGLWALPVYAWLLAVSAAAPRVPFVWAIIVPLVPMIIERAAFGTESIGKFIHTHTEFAALPDTINVVDGVLHPEVGLAEQFALLATSQMWLGLIVGAAFLWTAVWFRARNNDL